MTKIVYQVRNWGKYNKALVERGSITLWFHEETIQSWYAKPLGKKGRPQVYSEIAIECCALLRLRYRLPLRSAEGFARSLLELLQMELNVPSYTQICRREKKLSVKLKHHVRGPIHAVIDGSGLKVFGEGEWKVRQHGYSKRRMWRKLHLGIDVKSQEVVMMELTDNRIGENKKLASLLGQYSDGYSRIGADKGYDSFDCHEEVGCRGAESSILIQRKSKVRKRITEPGPPLVRDEIVRRIREVGREAWKIESNYHSRSLVETAFFRFKMLFGDKLHAHSLENQQVEALLCCNILNRFTQLGMPDSVPLD
jgi:hypothetical protein